MSFLAFWGFKLRGRLAVVMDFGRCSKSVLLDLDSLPTIQSTVWFS
jgi:hypothetical protein